MTGIPMVIIRLQGCGVGCSWCDTKETWHTAPQNRVGTMDAALGTNPRWTEAEPHTIARAARKAAPALRWALVTGGEPAEQYFASLVFALHVEGFQVAIETSGTAEGHLRAGFDWVCVSPKIGMPGGKRILPATLTPSDELKLVVASERDLVEFESLLDGVALKPHCVVSLQPVSQQPRATELCLKTCMQRRWRLSAQLRKCLGQR